MGLPDRIQSRSLSRRQVSQFTKALSMAETDLALDDLARHSAAHRVQADLAARHRAGGVALGLDMRLYDEGMLLAAGDPVRTELVLRAVQDQNSWNRRRINEAFQ